MKIDWVEYNKDFDKDSAKELKTISRLLLVSYISKNEDTPKERIGLLTFHKCANGDIGILDGHFYYDYFKWTKILKYCPLEV